MLTIFPPAVAPSPTTNDGLAESISATTNSPSTGVYVAN